MKKIGIVVKEGVTEAINAARDLIAVLDRKEFRVLVDSNAAGVLEMKGYPRKQIPSKADVIVVFGGDGTLLSVARLVGDKRTPILGVNLGGLGFITEANRKDVSKELIKKMFSKKCCFEERIMLSADVFRKGRKVFKSSALNDFVISKSALARMIHIDIHINRKYATSFRADGLIVSTPTGSTAHSLSAGGPILYPTLKSIVITPICPHTLANRPIVIPDMFIFEARIKDGNDVYLTLDGQEGFSLKVRDKVRIKKAAFTTRFILLHDRDYFSILRTKLKWGE